MESGSYKQHVCLRPRRCVPQANTLRLRAGFLPFSAIYIELYYIFASVWGHKVRFACLPTAEGVKRHRTLNH